MARSRPSAFEVNKGLTKALAYVPSTPNSSIGGLVLVSPAGEAYVRIVGVIRGVARRAAAKAGRAILEDIIVKICSNSGRRSRAEGL